MSVRVVSLESKTKCEDPRLERNSRYDTGKAINRTFDLRFERSDLCAEIIMINVETENAISLKRTIRPKAAC